ncbi:MAG: SGNH/GDSL hydrolase family protein [Spirochaetota bacterium]
MKTILCYGDSNTWGWNPKTMCRFAVEDRWTGVLAGQLGDGYRVIEEGLNGRTTVFEDPLEPGRNGRAYLWPCLQTHMPLDLVAIMLGTNDLKSRFAASAYEIADAAGRLVELARQSGAGTGGEAPRVLLVAPPPLGDTSRFGGDDPAYEGSELAWPQAVEKSRAFSRQYRRVADAHGCGFFDAASVVETSEIDGIHWEAGAHRAFGEALGRVIRAVV